MKLMAINPKNTILIFIAIFLISGVSALNFSLSSPDKVTQGKEFSVKIIPQETADGTYDVKIFVHKHTKEFSEIFYENVWKSPFNYLKGVFPATNEFKLKSNY